MKNDNASRVGLECLESRRLLAAGDLDMTFGGGDGVATFSTQVGLQLDRGLQIAVDNQGRTVAVGVTAANQNVGTAVDIVVARFTPAGVVDSTFGVGGAGFITYSARASDIPVDVAVQPDGRIVVALRAATTAPWGVLRLTDTGAPDPTFGGGDGIANYDFGSGLIQKMALQPDGRIVTVGAGTNFTTGQKGIVVRMKDDGTLDETFSGDGIATVEFIPGGLSTLADVTLDRGRIVALGTTRPSGSGQFDRAGIVRLTAAGAPDADFGTAGMTQIAVASTYVLPHSVAVDSASRVVVAAQWSPDIFLNPRPLELYRFIAGGAPDPTFNAGSANPGRLEVAAASYLSTSSAEMLVQGDDKVLFGGGYSDATSSAFNVVRVAPDGTLDATFSGDGVARFTPTAPQSAAGTDMAFDAQGRLVINGVTVVTSSTDFDFAVVRVDTALPVTLFGGVMRVRGTPGDDLAIVKRKGGLFTAEVNGATFAFDAALVSSIDVDLGGGIDTFVFDDAASASTTGATISGDLGQATLNGFGVAFAGLETFRYVDGAGGGAVSVRASATTKIIVEGGGPEDGAGPVDRLTIDAAPAPVGQVRTTSHDGSFTFAGAQPVQYKGFERAISPLDKTRPAGTPHFEFATSQAFVVSFGEDVGLSIEPGDVVLKNLTTGQVIPTASLVLNVGGGPNLPTTAEWTTFFGQPLADGDYHATIAADAVRDFADNPLVAAIEFDFYIMAGDADRNRRVDFDDLVKLAQSYNTTNKTFEQGNFNYAGGVDFDDLVVLAQRYNTTLGGSGGAAATASFEAAWAAAVSPVAPKAAAAAAKKQMPQAVFSVTPVKKPAPAKPPVAAARSTPRRG